MTELYELTAEELSREIAARRVSPVDIVRAHLDRIAAVNDRLRAYVFVDERGALADARAAEEAIVAGGPISPLHGVPIAYKDVCDVAGMPTTAGSRLMRNNVASKDSAVAALLRRAGTIALGKLNTYEFATGGQELFGEPRNPWNLAYSTGGSSTGPAAAIAGRLTPLALGTDTGGSVRMPASFCGIVGLRPTRGRVPREGLVTLSDTFDEIGPMTRTARDCALLFQALTGDELPAQIGFDSIRVGVPASLWAECNAEVKAAYDAAIATMRDLGARVVPVALPNAEYGPAASWALSFTEALASHRDRIAAQRRDYTSAFLAKIGGAECITPEDIRVATTISKLITKEFVDALVGVDVIALPTTPYPAYPLGQQHEQADNSVFVRPVSCSGLPGLSIPCGFTHDGLPIGLQLVGRPNAEQTLFGVAEAFERATSFVRRPPDVAIPAKTGDYWSVVKAQLARFSAS